MANERQYIDFYLQLRDLDLAAGALKVAVLPSPAVGETRKAVTANYTPDVLTPYLKQLKDRTIDQEKLSQLGKHLAAILLPTGEVRELFVQAVKSAGQDGGVRLRLLTSEPELARLPWEYAYLPFYEGASDYRHFLVLNPQISLVRHEPIAKQHPQMESVSAQKLNLLVAMANPQNDLNLAEEKQKLTQALEGFQVDGVTLDWQPVLDETTVQSLTKALMKKPELFYFSGHGAFDQEGVIQLHGDTASSTYRMPATELALKLKQAGVRVAMFGACESARRDGASEWAGVAPTMVAEGVPVVVAMQYSVLDKSAIAFSNAFYIALAAGLSVDEAVATGRLAMIGPEVSQRQNISLVSEAENDKLTNGPPANVQWGVPVLYMRSADSVIFPRQGSQASVVAEQIRKVIDQNIGSIRNSQNITGIKIERANNAFKITQSVDEIVDTDNFIGVSLGEI